MNRGLLSEGTLPKVAETRQLIPQPLKGEVKVQVVLPEEALCLLRDLHDDRQHIGMAAALVLLLLAAATVKYLFAKEKP
jgi:hypothetical protein